MNQQEDVDTLGLNEIIPLEIIFNVFSFLPFKELLRVSKVCKLWAALADDPLLYTNIILTSDDDVETEKVLNALEGKTHLNTLDLHSRKDCLEIFQCAAVNCPNLRQLSITASTVPREIVNTLVESCLSIECLNFEDSFFPGWDVGDSFLISKLKKLRVLNLSHTFGFPTCGIAKIAIECTQLSELCVDRVSSIPADVIFQLVDSRCETLRKLRLDGENMGPSSLQFIFSYCQNVPILGVEVASKMLDHTLIALSEAKNLLWLRLRGLTVSDTALDTMMTQCNMRNIRYLDLSDSIAIRNFSMKLIAKDCRSLVCLRLKGCDKVTSHGIAQLAEGCSLLQFLNVEGMTRINGRCLKDFPSKLSHLKLLNLNRCTEVSVESVSKLQESMPLLSILHIGHKNESPYRKSRLVAANTLLKHWENLSLVVTHHSIDISDSNSKT